VLERLNTVSRSLSKGFHGSIGTVANVANHLMSRGGALGKESIAYTLYITADQKLPRHYRLHTYFPRVS
jgi:hypothetical protein